jgi:hypothetical protein
MSNAELVVKNVVEVENFRLRVDAKSAILVMV